VHGWLYKGPSEACFCSANCLVYSISVLSSIIVTAYFSGLGSVFAFRCHDRARVMGMTGLVDWVILLVG
jgi:hypothetical protein